MKTAIVVDTPQVAKALNWLLQPGHIAFAVGESKAGHRFARIIVLATLDSDFFSEWFEHFKCCLAPDGDILYD
jgi:hypothetical protein